MIRERCIAIVASESKIGRMDNRRLILNANNAMDNIESEKGSIEYHELVIYNSVDSWSSVHLGI